MFERALAAAPNCPHVLTQFACRFYRDLCEFHKAQELLEKAVTLDPINAGPRASLSFVLRYQGRYEAALNEAEKAISINPTHGYANLSKIFSLISLREFSQASEMIKRMERIAGVGDTQLLNCSSRFYLISGDAAKANQTLKEIIRLSQQTHGEQFMPLAGWFYMIQGDVEQAVFWLEKSFEHRISQVLNTRPFAQILNDKQCSLLNNPLLQTFLRKMNLDDQSLSHYRQSGLFDETQ